MLPLSIYEFNKKINWNRRIYCYISRQLQNNIFTVFFHLNFCDFEMPLNATTKSLRMNLDVIYINSSKTLISLILSVKYISYKLLKHHIVQSLTIKLILSLKAKFQGLYIFKAHLNSICDNQIKPVFITAVLNVTTFTYPVICNKYRFIFKIT